MRYPASEKLEIIRLVEQSSLPVRRTLLQLSIPKSTFYGWYRRYVEGGLDALQDEASQPTRVWNKLPEQTSAAIIELALTEPALSARELAVKYTDTAKYYVSESTVYRLLKAQDLITSPAFIVMQAADKFSHPTTRVNELWQTDFTYLKVIGWGWFYLPTVLDDYSRFILAWRLCTGMVASDVSDTLEDALAFADIEQVNVKYRPRLLSDNGPSYVSGELAGWLESQNMRHTRARPYHPMTQGKIERWHRSMKNQILLDNYYLPGQLESAIESFVAYYNHERYHESLKNLTPADVYYGRGKKVLSMRREIKQRTLEQRRQLHYQQKVA
jgi:transposase InsO family protein